MGAFSRPNSTAFVVLPLCIGSLLHCALPARGQGDTSPQKSHWPRVQFVSGVSDYRLNEVTEFYDAVLEHYRLEEIPIASQRKYPENILIGLELTYNLTPEVMGGIVGQYSWTRAFSAYDDYSGSLDVNSSVRWFSIGYTLSRRLNQQGPWRPLIGGIAGLTHVTVDYDEVIKLTEFPELSEQAEVSFEATGFSGEIFVGTEYHFASLALVGQGGYRYCAPVDRAFDIDLSGIVFRMGIAFQL